MSLTLDNIGVVRDGRHILSHISFHVEAGRFVGILGPSGSGKSTLIEVLSLTGTATEGRVLFDGKSISQSAEEYRKNFRYVPQQDALYPTLTVRENVWYAARLLLPGRTQRELSDQVDLALDRVGLREHHDKPVGKLSGGQRKRVSIAMALLGRPKLLILDEPTSGLDPAMERKLMLLLRGISESGTTVVCSTHVMENVNLFDRIAVIDKIHVVGQSTDCGRLLDFLSTDEFLEKVRHQDDDYAKFFEQLEADPGVYYWDKSIRNNEPGLLNDMLEPFDIVLGPLHDTLRKIINATKLGLYSRCKPMGRLVDDTLRYSNPIRQTLDVFTRNFHVFFKDRFLLLSTLLLPPILGFLIVLSQQNETNVYPLLFFAIVISLWFGMNNSVRSVVGERKIFVRESLSGLTMNRFLLGKTLFYLLLGAAQIAVMWLVIETGAAGMCREMLNEKLTAAGPKTLALTLFASYFAGLGLGLLVSTLASTENVAVALVPLFIMPQILLSTVAAGNSAENFDDVERILPIAVSTMENDESDTSGWETAKTVELFRWASFFCYSRPALFMLELKVRSYDNEKTHRAERLHFLGLTTVTWGLLWLAFRYNKERWQISRN